jgi:hypothetical protein
MLASIRWLIVKTNPKIKDSKVEADTMPDVLAETCILVPSSVGVILEMCIVLRLCGRLGLEELSDSLKHISEFRRRIMSQSMRSLLLFKRELDGGVWLYRSGNPQHRVMAWRKMPFQRGIPGVNLG